ncbi:hypothetical protein KFZ56_02450 [Virgibacillus sp. NKC19-3]|uniref:hypothetical protein n=1 Tax=Virgibacillus saliphilus TaxID=2831674 RepID=UPI001C9B8A6B|nr:hypothetical protein [Virgibacillus sp. NKC19-3]MBY7141964.1 hypothetical protein [Virgibacillus sp. NKC19-3]
MKKTVGLLLGAFLIALVSFTGLTDTSNSSKSAAVSAPIAGGGDAWDNLKNDFVNGTGVGSDYWN